MKPLLWNPWPVNSQEGSPPWASTGKSRDSQGSSSPRRRPDYSPLLLWLGPAPAWAASSAAEGQLCPKASSGPALNSPFRDPAPLAILGRFCGRCCRWGSREAVGAGRGLRCSSCSVVPSPTESLPLLPLWSFPKATNVTLEEKMK